MPEGGRLTLYAPGATGNLTRCAHSCFSAGAADVATGVLTTPALQGAYARSDRPRVALWPLCAQIHPCSGEGGWSCVRAEPAQSHCASHSAGKLQAAPQCAGSARTTRLGAAASARDASLAGLHAQAACEGDSQTLCAARQHTTRTQDPRMPYKCPGGGAGEEVALEYSQPSMPVPGQPATGPVLRVASIMQACSGCPAGAALQASRRAR